MDRKLTLAAALAASMAFGASTFAQQSAGTSGAAAGGSSSSQQGQSGAASSGQSGSQSSQTGAAGQSGQRMGAMDMDKLFIKHASVSNMCEVQLSRLAQQKAQSQEVKQFAAKMVQDHQQAQTELQDLARKNNVQVSMTLPQEKQEMLQAFQQLSGADFDKHYISAMKADHAMAVSKYQDVSMMAKNQDLKTWAAGKVQALQQHAQMVASLATQQGLAAGPSSSDQAQPAGATIRPGSSSSDQNGSSSPGHSGSSRTSDSTGGSSSGSTPGGTSGGSSR